MEVCEFEVAEEDRKGGEEGDCGRNHGGVFEDVEFFVGEEGHGLGGVFINLGLLRLVKEINL